MVNFKLTDQDKEFKKIAHDFSKKEIRPNAQKFDETGNWPKDILKKAWELGLINSQIPEKFGGLNLNNFSASLITEELGWGCTGITTAITANTLAQTPLIIAGSTEQKNTYLRPFSEDHLICSYAVTEPGAGSDVAAVKTTAKKVKDKYILNGEKMWITGAGYASWFFVLASTDKEKGYKGMTAFIVPRDSIGITIGKKENNMGQRASDTRSILFDNVEVSEENRLGKEGQGFFIAMKAFDHTRPLVAAAAVGLSRSAMEYSIDYAKKRKTFGKCIWKNQGISFMISDMATDIEAARLLVWKAAVLGDLGEKNTLYAAHAKRFAADSAMKIATDAVQVFGGNGFNREYPVEKLMRDAKIFQIYEGTSQIQRMIITKEIFN